MTTALDKPHRCTTGHQSVMIWIGSWSTRICAKSTECHDLGFDGWQNIPKTIHKLDVRRANMG